MSVRINKIINWKGKEYAHIIEDDPNQFCDLCSFREECAKVLSKELLFDNSPMKICDELCKEENTHFAMFIENGTADSYVQGRNKTIQDHKD